MAMETIFEWKIENFSCWCEAMHDQCIKSPDFLSYVGFENMYLYPRGCSGQEDLIKVSFCDVRMDLIGNLTLACSDESSIHSQQVKITHREGRVHGLSVNLKFEEVVSRLRKADQKDEITLRFRFQSDAETEQRMCTTIGVWKVSFEIDPKLVQSVKPNQSKKISYFRCFSIRGQGIWLNIARRDGRIQLIMEPSVDMEEKDVLVESSVSMLSSDNDLVRKEVVKHLFTKTEAWTFSETLTVDEFEEKGITILLILKVINGEIVEKYNYYVNDKRVNTDPTGEDKSSKIRVSANQFDDSVTMLTKELMCLFQGQDFSDFQLKCGDVSIPVHKNILSARSPVFKTMLSCDMRETASSEVVIEDLDPSTLTLFLTFLYKGGVGDLEWDRALKLYYAADKYQVPSLKRECVSGLCSSVSVSNVCDILSLADKHQDDQLIKASRVFFLNNFYEVLASDEWNIFMRREPLLAVETLTKFGAEKCVGKIYSN